jgi:hypothetical protein
VFGPVGEQGFGHRQGERRGTHLAQSLFLRDPDPVVQRARPGARGNGPQALDVFRRHEFAALVAAGDEREVLVDPLQLGGKPRRFAAAASTPAAMAFRQAISASRFKTSKRIRTSWMRSWMVSSLVALSTTYSGVVTLPQSCSQAAM